MGLAEEMGFECTNTGPYMCSSSTSIKNQCHVKANIHKSADPSLCCVAKMVKLWPMLCASAQSRHRRITSKGMIKLQKLSIGSCELNTIWKGRIDGMTTRTRKSY